ncbi:hypothetical protein FNF27_06886 [Cafeteria roenbergensis]|uniref:Mitochondrial carrier protein n=2 Tax=Cafeteria roenbergensis TaxID=33653 RepID=A0A5A8D2Q3_CAFRO|nr:hypothetical protein FNF29_07733 [Cafeteria roenbergensis]KAA0158251.1 hypothetical protein FNF31_05485 [Cafeteria roenbergensis]KAA0169705.1 hypothetical protein FNF27_06886 [Cafeteria roenbergensis]|eukprot:KAA0146929.1 hypothetical protein FNF29_07733 [Cafeteria roenbergensis]
MDQAPGAPPSTEAIQWGELDPWKFYTIGPTVFFGVRAINHPMNVVKTRLQAQLAGAPAYSGTADAVRSIWRQEGARGFFKGFGTSMLNLAVGQIYISVFERMRSGDVALLNGLSEAQRTAVGACTAVLVSQTVSNPIDVVSQRLMVDRSGPAPRGAAWQPAALRVAREVVAGSGARGLFRGYWASILQMAPGSSLWWTSYGIYRNALLGCLGPAPAPWHPRAVEVVSGAMAGSTVAIIANPLDVLRTRVQVHGLPLLATLRSILFQEGLRGISAGMAARVATMAPNGALVMSAYELIKRLSLTDEARLARSQAAAAAAAERA